MGINILIADDEDLERRAIRKILEAEPSWQLYEAENGHEVLDLAARVPITVALLDIKMPGLDGIATADRLKQTHPEVAVVFLTAYDQFGYARAALRLQVDDFLLKPASAAEVLTTVRAVAARVASREGERESSRAALERLDSAIHLVADRLRSDLGEGMADLEQTQKFLCLQGIQGRPLAVWECRPAQAAALGNVARLAEALLGGGESVALAGVRDQTVRILRLGDPREAEDPLALVRRFREAVRTELGCNLLVGAAVAAEAVDPDVLVAAAHRAAAVATSANPILVVSVGADAPERPHGEASLPPAVAKALGILEARMTEELSLNEVAALVGLSPSHLSRQLARATGNGYAECLALFRIAAAKRHLADIALTVKEVAHLVGFHDPAYFARVFRKLEGCSPADFRADTERKGASS